MKKIGLTGNIACGKSLVESMLKKKGIPVIDSDKICHDLLDFDKNTIKNVKEAFKGLDILKEDKTMLDRSKIGQIIFKNQNLKTKLENILHPQVYRKIKEFFDLYKEKNCAVASVPLLFETKMGEIFDKVIVVITQEDIQLERLLKRSGFDIEHAKARMNSQMKQEEKVKLADFIIENSQNVENTESQLEMILEKLN